MATIDPQQYTRLGGERGGAWVANGFELAPVERTFCELVEIDSPSYHEREMADEVTRRMRAIGFDVTQDHSDGTNDGTYRHLTATRRFGELTSMRRAFELLAHTGSECGNLLGRLPGTGALADEDPILFVTHLDTVLPAHDKHAVVRPDGRIESMGDTVLGADDLAGVACMLAACERLERDGVAHRPVELACMVAEEVGNVGARAFDFTQCRAHMAYTLDYSADPHEYAYQAPTILIYTVEVLGKSAHAGFYPEQGVHAIKIAARAINEVACGRIGDDTTANVGVISGGRGNNVVPGTCVIRGEVRSFVHEKAQAEVQKVRDAFERAAQELGGRVTFQVHEACHAYCTHEDATVIRAFRRACATLGLPEASGKPTFGGSDNNVVATFGIPGIVIANGMRAAHSTREHVLPGDLRTIQAIVETLLTQPDEDPAE